MNTKTLTHYWKKNGYTLRSFQPGEAEKYYTECLACSDPEVDRLTGTNTRFDQETVVNYYNRIVTDPNRYDFMLIAPDGRFIGESVLNEIDWESKSANFRICIFRSKDCGTGIGSWAVQVTRDFAFAVLGLHRLELDVFSFNPRAKRAYEKAGFQVEGVKRDAILDLADGSLGDDILMAMLEDDWKARKTGQSSLHRHAVPILEYDESQTAVLEPNHEHLKVTFPKKAVFAFLGDEITLYAKTHHSEVMAEFVTISGTIPIYRIQYREEELALCRAPQGASAAVQMMDWLQGYGVETIISAGSCGALAHLPENTFFIPTHALRDEGTSYHYLAPSRYIALDPAVTAVMEQIFAEQNLSYLKGMTWTTDGFFRETAEMIAYRRAEGCMVVEMECAALTACAKMRGVRFGQFLYTADSLANAEAYDERGWGGNSLEPALRLCLEIAARL